METYLRLMFLKVRYRLGYESLCAEVADSIAWRLFCRIGIDGKVPHPTTLMKITTRCGSEAIEALNEALLAKAAEAKLLRVGKVRADTTVVSANVDYPTDAGLLAKAVGEDRPAGRAGSRPPARPPAPAARDRTRAAGRRARQIASKLRLRGAQARDEATRVVAAGSPATWPSWPTASARDAAAGAAQRPPRPAHRHRPPGRAAAPRRRRAGGHPRASPPSWSAQTRSRLAGVMPDAATPGGQPARPRRPADRAAAGSGKPIEFGYKAQVVDNEDGVIVDHTVEQGNPADAPQLAPAIARITRRAGRPPRAVTADRGYGEARVEADLHALGVRTVAIPRKGHPARPAARPNTDDPSAAWSNGAPAAKAASPTSNADPAGTAPASTDSPAPGSGADTASSPTTSPRSAP